MAEMFSSQATGHPMLTPVQSMRMGKGKIVTAEEAVSLIRDGDSVATEGFVGAGFPEEIIIQLKEHFLKTGSPKNLTLIYAAGQGAARPEV